MEIAFATMPRSGSEFLVRLTKALLGDGMPGEVLSVTPGRAVGPSDDRSQALREQMKRGSGVDYFRDAGVACAKLESPGSDTLCFELAAAFPDLKWLTSIRRIERIIASHHNIQSWGWPESRVLLAYVHDLVFLEYLAATGRLFVVNIDGPQWLDLDKMAAFFGCGSPSEAARRFADNWPVVNPLKRQQALAAEEVREAVAPPELDSLRTRHPWLTAIETRYRHLWERCI